MNTGTMFKFRLPIDTLLLAGIILAPAIGGAMVLAACRPDEPDKQHNQVEVSEKTDCLHSVELYAVAPDGTKLWRYNPYKTDCKGSEIFFSSKGAQVGTGGDAKRVPNTERDGITGEETIDPNGPTTHSNYGHQGLQLRQG